MANTQVTAVFKMECKDTRTDVVTMWFQVMIPGYEWTDLYVGLSKKGDWLSASGSFYNLDKAPRNHALSECRALLNKMR